MFQYLNSVRRKASQQLREDLTGTKLNLSVNPGYVHVSSLNNLTLQDLNSVFLHIQHCEIFFKRLTVAWIKIYWILWFIVSFHFLADWRVNITVVSSTNQTRKAVVKKSQDLFRGTKQMKGISLKKVEWELPKSNLLKSTTCSHT